MTSAGSLDERAWLDRARRRIAVWLSGHASEVALLLLGISLRASMRFRYDVDWAYDASEHWKYVEWLVAQRRLPPIASGSPDDLFEAFHPPLSYLVNAILSGHGVSRANMAWVSIFAGSARLGLIWWGLEHYLPSRPWARRSALALAAVLPASIHLEGMLFGEPLNGLFAMGLMLVAAPLLLAPAAPRWWLRAVAAGVLLGLGLLTKISILTVIAALCSAVALALWHHRRDGWRGLSLRLRPWPLLLAVATAVCGWYFARNVSKFGRPFITSFESTEVSQMKGTGDIPVIDRRPLGFVVGWSNDIFEVPYWPSALQPHARFFPVAIASTFVDYWNYSFSGIPVTAKAAHQSNGRPITPNLMTVSRGSMLGGTLLAATMAIALPACLRSCLRRRDWAGVGLLLVPLFTLAASLKFAIEYPFDLLGVVKGVYMQFGFPPLIASFGAAVDWSRRRPLRWPLCALLLLGLALVALYTVTCRTGFGLERV